MRRLVLVPLVLLVAWVLVGCGGSGGAADSSEEAWSGEVAAVMHHVRKDVESLEGEFAGLRPKQSAAEGMYMGLSGKVGAVTAELEAIETPAQCRPLMHEIVDSAHHFAGFAKELGDKKKMTTKEYADLAQEKISGIAGTVKELGQIAADPRC